MAKMVSFYGILVLFLLHVLGLQAIIFPSPSSDPYKEYTNLDFPSGPSAPSGPDSVALGPNNDGPYAGVSDGRIIKYNGKEFVDFAYTSPTRVKELCDGVKDIDSSQFCGRPLGFSFDPISKYLYIVGAYGNLYRVGPNGGLATILANNASGVPFNFLDGIDYDRLRNVVYFTDASLTYTFKDSVLRKPYPPGESSGRLLQYDVAREKVTVLLSGIPVPIGPAVSSDGTCVVYASVKTNQVFKYFLVGPKAGKTEVLLDLPGFPIKIKRAPAFNTFWIAVNVRRTGGLDPYGYKFNTNGDILLVKDFTAQYPNMQLNVVQEYDYLLQSKLYIASRPAPSVGIYSLW